METTHLYFLVHRLIFLLWGDRVLCRSLTDALYWILEADTPSLQRLDSLLAFHMCLQQVISLFYGFSVSSMVQHIINPFGPLNPGPTCLPCLLWNGASWLDAVLGSRPSLCIRCLISSCTVDLAEALQVDKVNLHWNKHLFLNELKIF